MLTIGIKKDNTTPKAYKNIENLVFESSLIALPNVDWWPSSNTI